MHLKIGPKKKAFNGRNKQIENETQDQQTIKTTTSTESNQTETLVTLQDILHKLTIGLDRLENKLDFINKVREPKIEFINVPKAKPAKAEINKTVSVTNKIVANAKITNCQERAEILENKGHQMNEKIIYMPVSVKSCVTQAQLKRRFSEECQSSQRYPASRNATRKLQSARVERII